MSQYPHLNSTYISPRLQSALCQIGSHAITTIIAPMGYGKSTAVKWWQQHEARQIPDACILRQLVDACRAAARAGLSGGAACAVSAV